MLRTQSNKLLVSNAITSASLLQLDAYWYLWACPVCWLTSKRSIKVRIVLDTSNLFQLLTAFLLKTPFLKTLSLILFAILYIIKLQSFCWKLLVLAYANRNVYILACICNIIEHKQQYASLFALIYVMFYLSFEFVSN